MEEVKYRIQSTRVPKPSVFINSGHGIHTYWFLEEPVNAKYIKPLLKYISKATGADSRAAEPARVMRLPYTFNNKFEPVSVSYTHLTLPTKRIV